MPFALKAQESGRSADAALPDAPSYARASNSASPGALVGPPEPVPAIIKVETPPQPRFHWQEATRQAMTALVFQHGARMAQPKTREQMGGPFFRDYVNSATNINGWGDGDSVLTNYVAHPMMGAVTGYVQVQNDGAGILQEFGGSRHYWNSRLRALAFSAAYSTQFEIGPFSEAAFGNVGMQKGTAGWVDFVMTPTGGFGLMLAEDALDRHFLANWEGSGSPNRKRVFRMLLNPNRSLANLLRRKVPWHRDTRPMFPLGEGEQGAVTAGAN